MPKMAKICYFCLKSGILCPKCQEKVRSGEVTELDLKVGRLLLSLEKDFPTLQDVELVKAIDSDDILVIIVGRGDMPRMLSYGGKIVKTLEKKIGKRVRILEQGSSDRKFLEDLFAPLDVLTINRIWLPDGTMETRDDPPSRICEITTRAGCGYEGGRAGGLEENPLLRGGQART